MRIEDFKNTIFPFGSVILHVLTDLEIKKTSIPVRGKMKTCQDGKLILIHRLTGKMRTLRMNQMQEEWLNMNNNKYFLHNAPWTATN